MRRRHDADHSETNPNRVRNQVDNELNDAPERGLLSAEAILAARQLKRAFQGEFPSGAEAAPATPGPSRGSSRLSGGSSFLPRVRSACCARLPRTHPPKVGLMHLSKYFSYAIDVNAVIK